MVDFEMPRRQRLHLLPLAGAEEAGEEHSRDGLDGLLHAAQRCRAEVGPGSTGRSTTVGMSASLASDSIEMTSLRLVTSGYDHVRELGEGSAVIDGIRVELGTAAEEELFYRFEQHSDWSMFEMSGPSTSGSSRAASAATSRFPFSSRAFSGTGQSTCAAAPSSGRRISQPRGLDCRIGRRRRQSMRAQSSCTNMACA